MEQVYVRDLVEATGGRLLAGDPDRAVSKIRLDSRQVEPGDLFVPIIGERVDGHKFIPQVIAAGAAVVLTSEHDQAAVAESGNAQNETNMPESAAWIRVEDTKAALQDIGRYLRGRLTLPLVGVTGSVGKTTTREMIAAALSAKYRVYKTPGNSNSQVGVPITISEISKEDEVGVIELGMSEPGELTVIAKIAKIDMAVITNIGITHIEQLGSRENIYKEKMTIQDGLREDGVLILNGDDDMLCNTKGKDGVKTIYYGTGINCDFRAENMNLNDGAAKFTAVHGEERQEVVLGVMGQHNVMNALAAMAVCSQCGMTMEEAARGLKTFHGFKGRQQIFAGEKFTILDDSYNASPASMKASLDVFKTLMPEKRHVAVLADMKELGEKVLEYHHDVGVHTANTGVNLVVTLGEACHALAEGVKSVSDIPVVEFLDKEEMVAYLDEHLEEGDCILFKGSNSMGLSAVAAHFVEKAGLN
ncbi:MAG: UDP-N-acetylmuramoyl-tripeptide--D-alanyl-D-alanine ligase [Lachnospiraceae bacterium]|nr:UDP-N-acetylmuramoyl-tripeptide--D-alanyl-D-alanine ligase [Lachnospiraceae bacterium]